SHTHGLVACAVTRGADVGLDVERIDRGVDARAIAARYFTEAEATFIESGPDGDPQLRFAEVWTLKEAFVKAVGRGLSHPLHEFGFAFEGPRGIRFDAGAGARAEDSSDWAFALFA